MAFVLLSRSRSKTQGSVRPVPKQKAARVQRPADSRSGFEKPVYQLKTTVLPTAPVIQTKLKIGEPNDKYEQEADRVADMVMRMPEPDPINQMALAGSGIGQRIQRLCPECEEELRRQPVNEEGTLQAKKNTGHTPPEVTSDLESRIQSLKGGGQPLPAPVRAFFEPRFGVDFSGVRVHTNGRAAQLAQAMNARAFTYGQNIWMGRDVSEGDKRLMAHELTHVVQQGAVPSTPCRSVASVSRKVVGPRVQRDRLPCTSRKKIDVYGVNLPGSSRTIHDDLVNTNSVLCQCGIELNVKGGESWDTDLLDRDPPLGVLNHSTATATREVQEMTAHRPGVNVLHAYYVPSISIGSRGSAFYASRYGGLFPGTTNALQIANSAAVDTFAHELVHVLMDDGGHHGDADNLMASGSTRNVGVDELEQTQCNRMP